MDGPLSTQDLVSRGAQARKAGDRDAAARAWTAAMAQAARGREPLPKTMAFDLGLVLYELKRFEQAEAVLRPAVERKPKEFQLQNLLGIVLKSLGRYDEALKCYDAAEKLDRSNISPIVNKGNVYITLRHGAKAVECFQRGVRAAPKSSEYRRLLGVSYRITGEHDKALVALESARALDPRDHRVYQALSGAHEELGDVTAALSVLDQGLALLGPVRQLVETKLAALRRAERGAESEALVRDIVARLPDEVWPLRELAKSIVIKDRDGANAAWRRALVLAPNDHEILTELAESLDRTRGPEEADNIQAGYEFAKQRIALGGNLVEDAKTLGNIVHRVGDYAAEALIGDFDTLGRYWASIGQHAALHYHLARSRTAQDRRSLIEWHRACGRLVEKRVQKVPIVASPAIGDRAKIRVGLMSSDLRHHPVSYFAQPLIEGYDRDRFEIYCYSWSTKPTDAAQDHLARHVDAFRWKGDISDRNAAQMVADDQLDIFLELGGMTDMNKLAVMAWRPAPRQASWLGYPHSAGFETIDRILVDPYINPPDPGLLMEKPFTLAHSWVTLGGMGFHERQVIEEGTPEERRGYLTFGTANNPYKYGLDMLKVWAECVRRVEGSRFLFIRPEGGTSAFRHNMRRIFEEAGVAGERVEFVAVRGAHMPHYNKVDIALDTFPHVGGTTTCEALWMATPTVTLVGEAFFGRLSYSNLANAGLIDLAAFDEAGFVETAVALAQDAPRRAELRRTMRERIRSHPLGQAHVFVKDFQDACLRWMDEEPRA